MKRSQVHILQSYFLLLFFPLVWVPYLYHFMREFLYQKGFLKSYTSKIKILSVGNISLGGTGKTPFSIKLIQNLLDKNKKPALCIRGYGSSSGKRSLDCLYREVPQGMISFTQEDIHNFGDEALQYRAKYKDLIIIVSPRRDEAVKRIEEAYPEVDCVVLDDAFQNRRIKKDLEIVLVDSSLKPLSKFMLPFGWMRMPFLSLKNANLVLLPKANLAPKSLKSYWLKQSRKYVTKSQVLCLDAEVIFPEKSIVESKKIVVFSAIADSELLFKSIKKHYKDVTADFIFKSFRDHHIFTEQDFREFKNYKPDLYFCTTKDFVKIVDPKILELTQLIYLDFSWSSQIDKAIDKIF